MSNINTPKPHPNYDDFEDFISVYCHHFARLCGDATAEEIKNGGYDRAELRKSYEAGEQAGDVAWDDYESSL